MLVNAFVFSTLLYSINKNSEKKMQRVINYAARLVGMLRRRDNVDSLLKTQGWLSVQIIKRISSIVFSSLKGGQSPLVSSLLRLEREETSHCHGTRRTNDSTLLQKPTTKTKFSENAFPDINDSLMSISFFKLSTTKWDVPLIYHILQIDLNMRASSD
jgi:hypothetical protein